MVFDGYLIWIMDLKWNWIGKWINELEIGYGCNVVWIWVRQ